MDSYSFIWMLLMLAAWMASTAKNRPVWAILCLFAGVSCLLNSIVWPLFEPDDYSLIVWHAAIEMYTIVAILMASQSRLAIYQVICLIASWYFNALLYWDLSNSTNMIYDRFEKAILLVAAAQLIPFAYGILVGATRQLLDTFHVRSPVRVDRVESVEGSSHKKPSSEARGSRA